MPSPRPAAAQCATWTRSCGRWPTRSRRACASRSSLTTRESSPPSSGWWTTATHSATRPRCCSSTASASCACAGRSPPSAGSTSTSRCACSTACSCARCTRCAPDRLVARRGLTAAPGGRWGARCRHRRVAYLAPAPHSPACAQVQTPAHWAYGDDVLVDPSLTDEEARQRFPRGHTQLLPYLKLTPAPDLGDDDS